MLPLCWSAGRDLSFLSGLRPELPAEKEAGGGGGGRVLRMPSCHLISAHRHYLFKAPPPGDTLAGAGFLREEGKQGEKKK